MIHDLTKMTTPPPSPYITSDEYFVPDCECVGWSFTKYGPIVELDRDSLALFTCLTAT